MPDEVVWCYVDSKPPKMTSSNSIVTSIIPKQLPRDTFYSVERASCGIAMEVAKADSKTNWEALMNHINESIRYDLSYQLGKNGIFSIFSIFTGLWHKPTALVADNGL